MTITFTSREFNRDASRVKKAADGGTVVITDRGRPAHVMMTIEAYEQLVNRTPKGQFVAFLESLPFSELDTMREADFGRDAPF